MTETKYKIVQEAEQTFVIYYRFVGKLEGEWQRYTSRYFATVEDAKAVVMLWKKLAEQPKFEAKVVWEE